MHLLVSLFPRHRALTPVKVDSIVCASWPNPDTEPILFDIVKQCVVYGPYGQAFSYAPCMHDGKCSKGFLKPFRPQILMTANNYLM